MFLLFVRCFGRLRRCYNNMILYAITIRSTLYSIELVSSRNKELLFSTKKKENPSKIKRNTIYPAFFFWFKFSNFRSEWRRVCDTGGNKFSTCCCCWLLHCCSCLLFRFIQFNSVSFKSVQCLYTRRCHTSQSMRIIVCKASYKYIPLMCQTRQKNKCVCKS